MAHTFNLTDRAGIAHEYVVALHPALQGLAITAELMTIGAEPLAKLADSALTGARLSALLAEALEGQDGDDSAPKPGITSQLEALTEGVDLLELLGDLDLPGTAAAFRSAVDGRDIAAMAPRILAHTCRGSDTLTPDVIDRVYAGNYGELLQACWYVIAANRFLVLAGT